MKPDKILNEEETQFNRSKIYEKLEYRAQPKDHDGGLPWNIQLQIAATNGKQYVDLVGKLKKYPEYELPVGKVNEGLMLDIGCGWGRWLVAGAQKGYLPIGLDLRIELCQASLQTLKDHNRNGYVVAADLIALPFRKSVFDLVWSFSVIQHTHRIRLMNCLGEIRRVMKEGGLAKLEFPNKDGFRNKRGPVQLSEKRADDFNSWVVRYYSVEEYAAIYNDVFGNFNYDIHSFLGIGVLKEDLKYVSFKNKVLCASSLALTRISKLFPALKKMGDSLYLEARNLGGDIDKVAVENLRRAHSEDPSNNLNIIHLLQCPITHQPLKLIEGNKDFVIDESGTWKYPVVKGVPIIIRSEAISV